MKKGAVLLVAVLCVICVFSFTACDAAYKKGVKIDDYPEKDVPIYDDAVVFSYETKGDKCKIKYGSEDDVDDIMEFYKEEFEDEDYHIYDEDIDDDEYSVEGIIDDITFEINVEQARGDKEEKYFDSVVEVKIIFDSNDYEEEGKAPDKDDDSINAEDGSSSAIEGEGLVNSEPSDESDGTVKVDAISDILEGQVHQSKAGTVTVEFGAIEVETGSNDYLHMECPLTVTNNSNDRIYIAVNDTWTNGLVFGTGDNCELNKGESEVLYADLGAYAYKMANVTEIKDLFFYCTVKDTYNYDEIDTVEVGVTNPASSYVQQDISGCPVVKVCEEVTVSYGGSYSDDHFYYLIFYVKNNNPVLDIRNEHIVSFQNVVLNDTEIEEQSFIVGTYGDATSFAECSLSKSDYADLFAGDSVTLNSAVVRVTDFYYNHINYDVEVVELGLNSLTVKPGTQSAVGDTENAEENNYSDESVGKLVQDAFEIIDEYGQDRFVEKVMLCSAAGEYNSLSEYEENVLYMASLMAGASSVGDPCEILLENGHITQKRADEIADLYNEWLESSGEDGDLQKDTLAVSEESLIGVWKMIGEEYLYPTLEPTEVKTLGTGVYIELLEDGVLKNYMLWELTDTEDEWEYDESTGVYSVYFTKTGYARECEVEIYQEDGEIYMCHTCEIGKLITKEYYLSVPEVKKYE